MKITWLGHSCFLLESEGFRLLLDPYRDVKGYPPLQVGVNAIYCSHEHYDHAAVEQAQMLLNLVHDPFTVTEVASWHDEQQGAKRGANTIRVLEAEGLRVVHLGDLGTDLDDEQIRQIGPVDLLLLPIGGTYTVGPVKANRVAHQLGDPAVIPMHYRVGDLGFDELSHLESFLAFYPEEQLLRLPGNSWQVEPRPGVVIVPTFQWSEE